MTLRTPFAPGLEDILSAAHGDDRVWLILTKVVRGGGGSGMYDEGKEFDNNKQLRQ